MKNLFQAKSEGDISSGSLDLFDYCLPPLSAGTWAIKTDQAIIWNEKGINQTYSKTQQFEVAGPRFTIDPSDVHAVYPPANTEGYFDNIFPHVVLTKRTLPWERTISGVQVDNAPTPWLTLMVLEVDDIIVENTKQQPVSRTANDLINPPATAKILGPQGLKNVTSDELNAPCYTVDIDPKVFQDIVPAKAELPYLSHCRKVNVENKEPQAGVMIDNGEGWYSVAVSNRLPKAGEKAFCCLVSLEGFEDYLFGGSKWDDIAKFDAVRIAVLAFWSIIPIKRETPSFSYLLKNIDVCQLKMPLTPAAKDTDGNQTPAQKLVTAALSDGYTPMTYETRVGEKTVAWYRGPFSSVVLKEDTSILPFFSAEAALIYDQTTGMFDASYAVAWQIGRLLALSDRSFSQGMLQWQQQQSQQLKGLVSQQSMSSAVHRLLELPESGLEFHSPAELLARIKEVFALKLAALFDYEEGLDLPPIMLRDKSGTLHRKGQLPGVLSPIEIEEVAKSGLPFYEAIKAKIFNGE